MVLMEAGAAGLPLVSTQLAAIPEIVRDGCTGLLVPAGDPLRLAEALGRLVADAPLRAALGSGAQQLVRRQFDAQANSQRLAELIKHVVDQN
jgi:glycosyltransferase involved in cell wall biosynthesis